MASSDNPFPSVPKYYVYQHVDPITHVIVYVGHGSGGRAWQCGSSHSPLRSKDHCEWSDNLLNKGYTPDDWVILEHKNLPKDEAKRFERMLIRELKPIFNKDIRSKSLKFTPDIYRQALSLREQGFTYKTIGEKVGLSTMVIHRGLNKLPISLEIALGQE